MFESERLVALSRCFFGSNVDCRRAWWGAKIPSRSWCWFLPFPFDLFLFLLGGGCAGGSGKSAVTMPPRLIGVGVLWRRLALEGLRRAGRSRLCVPVQRSVLAACIVLIVLDCGACWCFGVAGPYTSLHSPAQHRCGHHIRGGGSQYQGKRHPERKRSHTTKLVCIFKHGNSNAC